MKRAGVINCPLLSVAVNVKQLIYCQQSENLLSMSNRKSQLPSHRLPPTKKKTSLKLSFSTQLWLTVFTVSNLDPEGQKTDGRGESAATAKCERWHIIRATTEMSRKIKAMKETERCLTGQETVKRKREWGGKGRRWDVWVDGYIQPHSVFLCKELKEHVLCWYFQLACEWVL